MNTEIALNNIVNYFCDILELPEGELPGRLDDHWDDVLKLANDQNVYFYLAAWMLEHWDSDLTDSMKERFVRDLEWNKVRNRILQDEILQLARIFRQADVKAMFLKGSAGIVRKLYPPQVRYLSDIDILIPDNDFRQVHQSLLENGYHTKKEVHIQNIKRHHSEPYYNQNSLGTIELHIDPYQQNYYSREQLVQFWNNAEYIEYYVEKTLVPSIADHAWIQIRTDLLARVCIPRIKDAIELAVLLDYAEGSWLDEVIVKATEHNVPNVAYGALYAAQKYVNPEIPTVIGKWNGSFRQWEKWSNSYRKKHLLDDDQSYNKEKDFAAVRFYPAHTILSKMKFVLWLLRYNYRSYISYMLIEAHLYQIVRAVKHVVIPKKRV